MTHTLWKTILALNNNIILHMWKLDSIILIPKPNKSNNLGTLYRPSLLISISAKTYFHTSYISQTTIHTSLHNTSSKRNHSTDTALHNINNTIATQLFATQHFETQHLHKDKLKLVYHKEAFFKPHTSTYTPQTYLLLPNTYNS